MRSIIGRTAGALGLGAALLVTGCGRESASVAAAAAAPAGAIVNCGEGRQAVVHPVIAGSTASQVECVQTAPTYPTTAFAPGVAPAVTEAPVRERVVERVVYKQAPAQQRVVHRAEPVVADNGPVAEPAVYRTRTSYPGAEPVDYPQQRYPERTSYPARSDSRYPADDRYPVENDKAPRSIGKSAVIIAGAAAGGAGVGAIIGGKSGAWKGAVVGGVAGTIYDQVTRRK
jgi:hypothetical protein